MSELNKATIDEVHRLRAEVQSLQKDKIRLDFCDTIIDLEPYFYVFRFEVAESCGIRQAIDKAMRDRAAIATFKGPPPISNEHVAEGCEQFGSPEEVK